MGQHTTTSERLDELPLLVYWLQQMRVDVIMDSVLGPPHGNGDGLSYGEVAWVFLTHMVTRCTHFLNPVEEWLGPVHPAIRHLVPYHFDLVINASEPGGPDSQPQ